MFSILDMRALAAILTATCRALVPETGSREQETMYAAQEAIEDGSRMNMSRRATCMRIIWCRDLPLRRGIKLIVEASPRVRAWLQSGALRVRIYPAAAGAVGRGQ
jgi:hypothetical protein